MWQYVQYFSTYWLCSAWSRYWGGVVATTSHRNYFLPGQSDGGQKMLRFVRKISGKIVGGTSKISVGRNVMSQWVRAGVLRGLGGGGVLLKYMGVRPMPMSENFWTLSWRSWRLSGNSNWEQVLTSNQVIDPARISCRKMVTSFVWKVVMSEYIQNDLRSWK